MAEGLKIPEFKTEADEARWWFEHREQFAQKFDRAAAQAKLGRGTVARRGNTPTTTIRLDPEDIAKARLHAAEKGLKYQTYLKMLIHEGLKKETASSDRGDSVAGRLQRRSAKAK